MTEPARKTHWLVRMHYRVRAIFFAATYAGFAAQMWGKGFGDAAWALLFVQFMVYPHLAFWWTRRAGDSLRTALDNLLLDSLLMGIWVAVIGLPLWVAFTLYIANMLNSAINRGWRGALVASGLFFAGALATVLVTGFALPPPETEAITVALCIVLFSIYLSWIGNMMFERNKKLREARQRLEFSEMALLDSNAMLRSQLAEIDRLHRQASDQANRDALTGLYNRRYLDSTLERELARCKREGRPLSLMMMDLDHFKQVNDTYGHQAGDEILKEIGALLASHARAGDIACRYGGEEFTLLLPNMPLDAARERAENLRAEFAAMAVRFGEFAIRSTLSIGIAVYPEHGKLPDELTQRADLALYRAKAEGRNRVVVFDRTLAAAGT
jgi:diguanylate cyclase (GGDEF)-like protein